MDLSHIVYITDYKLKLAWDTLGHRNVTGFWMLASLLCQAAWDVIWKARHHSRPW